MIPRVLHRIVLPPMEDEGYVAENWVNFAALHPTWELKSWTSADPRDWQLVGGLLAKSFSPAQRADLLRLEILWREGGVYVDTDCEPVRALDPLLTAEMFIGSEDGISLTNAVMGAEPGHPAIKAYIDAVVASFKPYEPPHISTGPRVATEVLGQRTDVTVLPPVAFYPESFSHGGSNPTPVAEFLDAGTYIVHRWAKTWSADWTLRRRLWRRFRRGVARLV